MKLLETTPWRLVATTAALLALAFVRPAAADDDDYYDEYGDEYYEEDTDSYDSLRRYGPHCEPSPYVDVRFRNYSRHYIQTLKRWAFSKIRIGSTSPKDVETPQRLMSTPEVSDTY